VIIFKQGYQEFSGLQSNVVTKVKGAAQGNITHETANVNFNLSHAKYYNRVWDSLDIVQPSIVSDLDRFIFELFN
jgi:phage-related protein